MTLAALSPLYTWWPAAFAALAFIVKVICPTIVRRQTEPPAELVATISAWPAPACKRSGDVFIVDAVRWAPPVSPERVLDDGRSVRYHLMSRNLDWFRANPRRIVAGKTPRSIIWAPPIEAERVR